MFSRFFGRFRVSRILNRGYCHHNSHHLSTYFGRGRCFLNSNDLEIIRRDYEVTPFIFPLRTYQLRFYSENKNEDSIEDVVKKLEFFTERTRSKFILTYFSIAVLLSCAVLIVIFVFNRRKEKLHQKTVQKIIRRLEESIARGEVEKFIDTHFIELLRDPEFVNVCAKVLRHNLVENEKNMKVVRHLFLSYLKHNEKSLEKMIVQYVREGVLDHNPIVDQVFTDFLIHFFHTDYGRGVFRDVVVNTLQDEVMRDRNQWLLAYLLEDEDLQRKYEDEVRRSIVLYVLRSPYIIDQVKSQMKDILEGFREQ